MTAVAGTAVVEIKPDLDALNKQLSAAMSKSRLGKLGKAGGVALTAGLTGGIAAGVAAGRVLYDIGEQFDDAADRIRVGTGKTGRDLRGLERDFKAVVRSVPADFGSAGDAITDLNRRLGLSGKPLQRLSKQVLELSRITGTDIRENVPAITRLFGDWSVRTDRQAKTLDRLFRASQATGIGVSDLSRYMVQFGSPLRQLGLDFDFSAAMFARFEKDGVNIQTLMPGLRMALKNFSQDGREPAKALKETFDAIKRTADTARANQIAFRIFGARAGPDMAAAIREGRFDLDALMSTMRRGRDTILRAGRDTMDFTERWLVFKNRAMVGLAPLADRVFGAVGDAMGEITKIMDSRSFSDTEKLERVFDIVLDEISGLATEAVDIAAKVAPRIVAALASGIAISWTDMSPLAKLFTAGAVLSAVGGRGAILNSGAAIGRVLGLGVATGAASAAATGAAGGAAGGAAAGLIGSMRSKLLPLAKRAGLVGVGLTLADGVIQEFGDRAKERSDDLLKGLEGFRDVSFGETVGSMASDATGGAVGKNVFATEKASADQLLAVVNQIGSRRVLMSQAEITRIAQAGRTLDLTRAQREQLDRIVALLRAGSRLRLGVDLNMDPRGVRQFENGLGKLRNGTLNSLQDILKVSRRNMRLISETWGDGTARGREAAARNMRATANAIEAQMRRSGDVTNRGVQRVISLLRNADLISPSRKMAADFGRGWADGMDSSKEITRRGVASLLAEARKMPGPMRKVALETWLAQLDAARKNRRITADEFRTLRSRVASEFTGMRTASRDAATVVPENVWALVSETTGGLMTLGTNTNKVLSAFGARPMAFDLQSARAQRRQTGGVIVPGTGSGDKVPAVLPVGTGILNRNATRALLEPGELAIPPQNVAKMGGPKAIHAMNSAVPRFQEGGIAGAIAAINKVDAAQFPYLWGGGHGSSPAQFGAFDCSGFVSYVLQQAGIQIPTMVSGSLANAGLPGPGPITVYANPTHTLMSVMGRFAGTSGSNPGGGAGWMPNPGEGYLSRFAVRHFEAIMMELEKLQLAGPDGPLRDLGQGALDKVRSAGNATIRRIASSFTGGGDAGDPGPGGAKAGGGAYAKSDLMRLWQGVGGASGSSNLAAAIALAESSGNPNTVNHNTNGTVDRGLWQINSIHGALSTLDPTANAQAAKSISSNGSNWSPWVAYNTGRHQQFLQLGGIVQALQAGGVIGGGGGILGQIDRTIRMNRKPFPRRARAKQLRKTLGLVDDIGLSPERQRALTELSNQADQFMDFGQRAGALSYEMTYAERTPALNPDGTPILDADRRETFHEPGDPVLDAERRPMTFLAQVGGLTEAGNTQKRLQSLLELRNRLLSSEGTVRGEQLRTATLIQQTRERLETIKRAIAEAAEVRRRVRRQIAESERTLRRLRKELKRARDDFEDERDRLERLREHPRRNRQKIVDTQDRIERLRETIIGLRNRIGGEEGTLGDLRERNRAIGEQQKVRVGERESLTKILGDDTSGLLGKQGRLRDFYGEILGSGGDTFKGLITVQGAGAPFDQISGTPPTGLLGGEVFDAQQLLDQLAVKPLPVALPTFGTDDSGTTVERDDSERLALQEQINRDLSQRYAVSQAQYRVLEGFDLPPYGGSFATGGEVPGPPGAARTIIAHGGETVVPKGAAGMQVVVVVQDSAVDTRRIQGIANGEAVRVVRSAANGVRSAPGLRSIR